MLVERELLRISVVFQLSEVKEKAMKKADQCHIVGFVIFRSFRRVPSLFPSPERAAREA